MGQFVLLRVPWGYSGAVVASAAGDVAEDCFPLFDGSCSTSERAAPSRKLQIRFRKLAEVMSVSNTVVCIVADGVPPVAVAGLASFSCSSSWTYPSPERNQLSERMSPLAAA